MTISRFFHSLEMVLLSATALAVQAQPPPPPPPGMLDYVTLLEESYNDRRIEDYGALFDPAVRVYVEGKLVASNRPALLARTRLEFERNLHLRALSWAQGNQLLVMEEVMGCIPVNPDPNTVYHGCPGARAIRYDLGDGGKIASVHILDAESAWNMHPAADEKPTSR